MDLLKEIFEKQKILQERLGYDFDAMTDKERAAYIKEYTQHADHELHEMLAEIPFFKSWKKYTDKPELNEACWEVAQEEFIDALHFFVNIALGLRFDAELLYCMFVDKNDVNHGRQEDHTNYKPCVEPTGGLE